MKNIRPQLLILLLLSMVCASCLKEAFDPQKQFDIEKPIIEEYALANLPGATMHEGTGIWYTILEPATEGEDPYEYSLNPSGAYVIAPDVEIKYRGTLLNGNEFDSNTNGVTFNLGGLIGAWQIMFYPAEIDNIQVGGILEHGLQKGMKVRFVTPSYYAYGERGSNGVPANSPLDFTIEVLDIRNPGSNQN